MFKQKETKLIIKNIKSVSKTKTIILYLTLKKENLF
jgi:hypothetical protein